MKPNKKSYGKARELIESDNRIKQAFSNLINACCFTNFSEVKGKIEPDLTNAWLKNNLKGIENWEIDKKYPFKGKERFDFKYQCSSACAMYVEVELRDKIAIDHDLCKFARVNNRNNLYVLITVDETLSKKIGKNIASYEYACKVVEEANIFSFPLAIIGLEIVNKDNNEVIRRHEDFPPIEKSKLKKMKSAVGFYDGEEWQ